ncbi:MAG: THUMP domain-containing protein [Candidatus Heimdallarchaeaceae archaeon]
MTEFLSMVMVRFSEIAIKSSKTRRWLTSRLISHIDFLLKVHEIEEFQIIREYSRVFVVSTANKKVENIIASLVPGAVSTSEVFQCSSQIDEIQLCVEKHFFSKFIKGSTFAVKAKRTGKHPYSSVELGAKIGEFILESNEDKELRVNLSNPEYLLNIEVRDDKAYVFDETQRGLGGLPVGCQGKVLVVVSGEQEDISNIIQLYKRGAVTLIYSIQEISEIEEKFRETIERIIKIQPQLKERERKIRFSEENFEINDLLEYYSKTECLGITLSKKMFTKLENDIPVSLPIFIPNLVIEVDEAEISSILAAVI